MDLLLKKMGTLVFLQVLLFFYSPADGQTGRVVSTDPVTDGLVKDLDQYRSQRLAEKVYVHTDKQFYLAGEICWFKLYDVDAERHHPLGLSKVAYLEWLDKNNKPILQAKIGLKDGHGEGSVYLPLTLSSGNYKLRAYTSWMRNYGEDWFFEKTITVVNARKSAEVPAAEIPLQYSITFFPEGGNLVENSPARIAFRVTDQYGRGIECTGVITEDDQDTVVRFRPLRFGIGSFMLTPGSGHRYRSTIRLADGTAVSTLLPTAYKEGITMHVSKQGADQIRVELNASSSQASEVEGSSLYLLAHTRQSVRVAQMTTLRNGKASFLFDRNQLGEGISHLTIFNGQRMPVCERLIFKAPANPLHVVLNTDKDSYSTRKKISLRIAAGTDTTTGRQERQGAYADYSLAVYKIDSMKAIPAEHIASYLWLSSDLNGAIESPDYYLEHPEDEEAADNLMMTHGWRRFKWGDVLQHSNPGFDFVPEYKGAVVTGKVLDTRTGQAAKDIETFLSMPGTRTQFSSDISDEAGRVKFELSDFYGGQEIIMQYYKGFDSSYRIDIVNPFSEVYTNRVLAPFVPPVLYPQTINDRSVALQALNRYGGEKLKKFDFPDVDTSTFYLKPDFSYLLDDYTRFTTMEEVMREYVRLMLVKKRGDHFHLPLFDLPNNTFFETDPLILLDGVPIFDIDKFMTMDPLKIRKLEVVNRKYFQGVNSYDGIMNWSTYKGDLGGYILDPHTAVIDYEGLQLQREFYSPSYATDAEAATHLPDFRNVLYWSPVVPVDSTGAGSLSFFSSDLPGRYIAVVEGLTPDGRAGSGFLQFEVK